MTGIEVNSESYFPSCGSSSSQYCLCCRCWCVQAFIIQRNYSSHVPLTKVHEGGEPAEFKALFSLWERERPPGQVKPVASRIGNSLIIVISSLLVC